MQNQNKCLGCGALKQNTDENKVGYVKDLNSSYCFDCFSLKNYGKSKNHFHPDKYLEIKDHSLVLIIQSVMQIDLLFTQPIERIQPNAKYVYILNQVDLLPRDTNLDYLHEKIEKLAKKNKVKFFDIIFMSAINPSDTTNLKRYLMEQKQKDIYLFGYQNSGKSTIFKSLTNNKDVLNLNKAGLTQEIIKSNFLDKTIYDMPGNYISGNLSEIFDYEEYRKLLPSKTIKPKVYQLKENQKLVINDYIEITSSNDVNLVFYINEFSKIMKYNLANLNNYLNLEYEYTNKTFKVGQEKMHITIADLMFIQVSGNTNLTVKLPKKLRLTISESLLK